MMIPLIAKLLHYFKYLLIGNHVDINLDTDYLDTDFLESFPGSQWDEFNSDLGKLPWIEYDDKQP